MDLRRKKTREPANPIFILTQEQRKKAQRKEKVTAINTKSYVWATPNLDTEFRAPGSRPDNAAFSS